VKIVKNVLLGLVAVVVALVAIAYALPSHYQLARSIDIDAPPAKIYPLVANVHAWKDWSAWNGRDPNMQIVYSGPESGPGAKWSWTSKSEGKGEMAFTGAEPDKRLDYALYFPDFESHANGVFTFEPVSATTTRVTWTNEGDLGNNPISRWMGLAMDKMVGNDFATGLANLKTLATR
jgi:uncharacterized protein YndB with AHSA1/START domain